MAVLTAAAVTIGWPRFGESTLGLVLTGRCDCWLGRGGMGGCAEDRDRREERRRDRDSGSTPGRAMPFPG